MRETNGRLSGNKMPMEALLWEAGRFDLVSHEDLDEKILRIIRGPVKTGKGFRVREFFRYPAARYILAFSLIMVFWVTVGRIMSRRDRELKDEVYTAVISRIMAINEKKDVDKALGIFSEDFFRQNNRGDFRKNIEELFQNYTPLKYKPEKEEVVMNGNSILIKNRIRYTATAVNSGFKSIMMEGKERIYLKKDRDQWKIVAWVFEK